MSSVCVKYTVGVRTWLAQLSMRTKGGGGGAASLALSKGLNIKLLSCDLNIKNRGSKHHNNTLNSI